MTPLESKTERASVESNHWPVTGGSPRTPRPETERLSATSQRMRGFRKPVKKSSCARTLIKSSTTLRPTTSSGKLLCGLRHNRIAQLKRMIFEICRRFARWLPMRMSWLLRTSLQIWLSRRVWTVRRQPTAEILRQSRRQKPAARRTRRQADPDHQHRLEVRLHSAALRPAAIVGALPRPRSPDHRRAVERLRRAGTRRPHRDQQDRA